MVELSFYVICDCGCRPAQVVWRGEDPAEVDRVVELEQFYLPRFACTCGRLKLADRYAFRAGGQELETGPGARFEREPE